MTSTAAAPEPPAVTTSRLQDVGGALLRVGGVFITVVLVMVIFAVLSGGKFLIPGNLLGMLRYASTVAILGMGLLLVIVVGEIDLSFGSLYGLCAIAMAVSWIAVGLALWRRSRSRSRSPSSGACFNAYFTTVVKIPSFIATLGSATLIFGFTLLITNTKTFNYLHPDRAHGVARGRQHVPRTRQPGTAGEVPDAGCLDDRHRVRRSGSCSAARCSGSGSRPSAATPRRHA